MPLQRALAGALASRYDLVVPERCVLSELASRYVLVVLGWCVLRELELRGGRRDCDSNVHDHVATQLAHIDVLVVLGIAMCAHIRFRLLRNHRIIHVAHSSSSSGNFWVRALHSLGRHRDSMSEGGAASLADKYVR